MEDQITRLKELGISFKSNVSIDYLLAQFQREEYEQDPYYTLLTVLGGEIDDGNNDFEIASNDIWYFDMECIEDEDIYTNLAARMSSLTKDKLPIRNIKSQVDHENEKAWISFDMFHRNYEWILAYNYDWIDLGFIEKFSELCKEENTEERFMYIHFEQHCLLAFGNEELCRRLNKLMKYQFEYVAG